MTPINIPKTKQRKKKKNLVQSPIQQECFNKSRKPIPKLINKHFPRHHKFYKLFNKNNVKVSCSCMPNMKNIINTHNKKIINPPKDNTTRTCNCIRKHQCLLNKKCPTSYVFPTNTPRVFHVEATWKRSFPRRFNVEYMWSVCRVIQSKYHTKRKKFENENLLWS